jgi:helix-turn-helix protein
VRTVERVSPEINGALVEVFVVEDVVVEDVVVEVVVVVLAICGGTTDGRINSCAIRANCARSAARVSRVSDSTTVPAR